MSDKEEFSTLELLAREVGRITSAGRAKVDVGLTELGVDSINVIELIVFCEQLYGVFDPQKLEVSSFTTLSDLDRQLTEMTRQEAVEA